MSIFFDCSCGQELTVPPEMVGKQVRCPVCKLVHTVTEPVMATLAEDESPSAEDEADDASEDADSSEKTGFASEGLADVRRVDLAAASSHGAEGQIGLIALRSPPTCLAYSGDDRWGAAGIDHDVQILDMRDHKRAYKIDRHDEDVSALRFSPDGRRLLSGDAAGRILVWDVLQKRALRWLEGHEREVLAIDISADGSYAASASDGGDIRAWTLETGDEVPLREAKWDTEATCVAFSPTDLSFAVGGKNGDVDVWDLLTGDPLERPPTAPMEVRSLSFAKDGESLTGCGIGSTIRTNRAWRWKVPSGASIHCWEQGGRNDSWEVLNAVLAGGKHLASIAEVPKERQLARPGLMPRLAADPGAAIGNVLLAGYAAYQVAQEFSPNNQFRIELWNVKLGTRIRSGLFKGPTPRCLAVSPSGRRLMFSYGADGKGRVVVWGIKT